MLRQWQKKPAHYVPILLVLLILAAYGRFLLPGIISAGDWLYPNPMRILQPLSWPMLFLPYNLQGYYGILLPPTVLGGLFVFAYAKLHLSIPLITWLMYQLPAIALMTVGAWRLLSSLKYPPLSRLIGTLIYGLNPFVLILLVGGQINGAVAYGCIPWVMLMIDQLWQKPRALPAIYLALWLTVQSIYEPRYIFITAIIAAVWLLFRLWERRPTARFWLLAFLAVDIFILLNLYWLYGVFFVHGTALVPAGYGDPSWLKTLSYANVWHALFLQHVWWPYSGRVSAPLWYFALLPMAALLGLAFNRKNKLAVGLAGLLLLGVFLAKGVNPPGGLGYQWLFTHVPGFSGFRDPAKFFTIIAFAYTLLVPLGATVLIKQRKRWLRVAFFTLYAVVMIVGFQPLWRHRVAGTFSSHNIIAADQADQWLKQAPGYSDTYSTFFIPTLNRFASNDNNHPAILANDEPIRSVRTRLPGLDHWLNEGDYETDIAPALRYLLTAYGVRYVVVPGDATNEFYQVAYDYSQQKMVDSLQSTGIFTKQQDIADQSGKSSTVLSYPGLGKGFLSSQVVITDTADHPAIKPLLNAGPEKNLFVWKDDITNSAPEIYPRAAYIIQQPDLNQQLFAQGQVEWSFTVAVAGKYRLGLTDIPADYLLDGQPLAITKTDQLDEQNYRFSDYQALTAGQHTLRLELKTDQLESILSGATANWRGCQHEAVKPLSGFNEAANSKAMLSQSWSQIDNLSGDTRCVMADILPDIKSSTLLVKWSGEVTSGEPYVWLNMQPVAGENYQLQSLNQKILTTKKDSYERAFLALILPAKEKTAVRTKELNVWQLGKADKPVTSTVLQPEGAVTSDSKQAVEIKQINDHEYRVIVPDHAAGEWLTVSVDYHAGWRLVRQADNKAVPIHFSSLLKQNSWYLAPGQSGEFKLEFYPYHNIVVANYISAAAGVGVLGYLLYRWRLARRRKC